MSNYTKYIIVFVTAKDKGEAEKISRGLLEKRLAACCSFIEGARSLYWWQGKIGSSREVQVIIKTRGDRFKALEKEVRRLHSYTTPEIVAVPIVEGSSPYLRWIDEAMS